VELTSPPAESDAFRIARFVRTIDEGLPDWRPWEREAFEADLLSAIPE
jgi:hypothetical protein